MASDVIWAKFALAQLQQISAYVAADSPTAAARMTAKLHQAGDSLTDFPDRGQLVGRGVRRLVVRPYLIRYRQAHGVVTILSVRHGARRPLR